MYIIPVIVAVGLLVFAGVFFGVVALVRPYWALDRVRYGQTSSGPSAWHDYLGRVEGFLKSVGETIPRRPDEMSRQGLRLVQAGIRRKDGPILFVGIQVGVAFLAFLAFNLSGLVNPLLGVILSIFIGAALPDILLKMKIRARQDRLQQSLPDCLDLTVVCVEAGLGLDHSLKRIGEALRVSYPDLSDELNLFNLEIRAGRARAEAMRNLARRTNLDDLKALVAVLIQSDRFGTSVAQSLRVFADSMRTKRRQNAEEKAAKIAIKMIPPMVIFVFPAIFVVVAGPAVISIFRGLLPMLSGN